MSENQPVNLEGIPVFTGDLALLDTTVTALSKGGAKIATAAGDIHSSFGGLQAFYKAPEAEQLFAVTKPVADRGASLKSDVATIASALSAYSDDAYPLVEKLKQLKRDAGTFLAKANADDKWREDGDLVEENNNRRSEIAETWAAFQAVERACHNKIIALVPGGQKLKTNDGSNGKGMYGYDAEAMKNAKGLPWGDPVQESKPWWHLHEHAWDFAKGVFVDGVWGTIKGLGTLFGTEGWDAAKQAWTGLGKLVTGIAISSTPLAGAFWMAPEDQLPSWLRDSRTAMKETGKALLAWDQWSENPSRAAGAVTFNVLTTVFTGGTGGAAAGAGKAAAAAKALSFAGKAGRAIDPMTYLFKGAGAGFTKTSDVMSGLKGMGNVEIPTVPEGAVTLPDGGFKLADGTLHLPEGAAIPDGAFAVPKNTVKLPDGMDIPAGALDLGDGVVRLPEGMAPPAGSLPIAEGSLKLPEGTTALPEGTIKDVDADGNVIHLDREGNILTEDGTLKQHHTAAPKDTPTDGAPIRTDADSPLPRTPAEQSALVGAGARTGGDPIRLSADLGDTGRLGDDLGRTGNGGSHLDRTPGGTANNLPGGTTAANNLPTNSLDNGTPGGPAHGGRGDHVPTNNLDNGRPGPPRTDSTGAGGSYPEPPATGVGHNTPGGSAVDGTVPGPSAADTGGRNNDVPARSSDEAAAIAEYEAARDVPPSERTPEQRAAITREHVRLANEGGPWFKENYDEIGRRESSRRKVDGQLLPKLARRDDGSWMAADDLPYANGESYRLEPMHRGRDTVSPEDLKHLDDVSAKRRAGMELTAASKGYQTTPSLDNADTLAKAQAKYDATVGEGVPNNSKLGEALGEDAARRHLMLQGGFEGSREITDLPNTPNGSKRFDQLWRTKDGNLVIVEAKGPNANLDWRRGNGILDSGTMVKQGTLEYVRTIVADMESRALTSPLDAKYAQEIRAAIENKTLQYVLVQASENPGTYAGAHMKHFKIF
ncbi:hypothetical protein CIB93_08475 [Streptomyces sp. WZ.A104]|uniref:hypothetical protein n=1 Tax=Streptomyces sp. WZ.A104 TaxID=2023771 RepID=UPI000BBC0EF1|nr:hypothetical protein [Streptomyces sp. WZ.A104]PCG86516.1 hypothetical protein CIB93_08475 [Streptomyces sp. WZ.A104]